MNWDTEKLLKKIDSRIKNAHLYPDLDWILSPSFKEDVTKLILRLEKINNINNIGLPCPQFDGDEVAWFNKKAFKAICFWNEKEGLMMGVMDAKVHLPEYLNPTDEEIAEKMKWILV